MKKRMKTVRKVKKKRYKQIDNIQFRKVKKTGKSRKGTYYYIREQGKKGKYYKQKRGIGIEDYVKAYKRGLRNRRKGVYTVKKGHDAEAYLKKIRIRPLIDPQIRKGESRYDFGDIRKLTPIRIRTGYERMLEPLMKRKDNLKVISKEENIIKYKYRLESDITIKGGENESISFRTFGKTASETQREVKWLLKKGFITGEDREKLGKMGYKIYEEKGVNVLDTYPKKPIIKKIEEIKMTIIYRKGR